MKWLCKGAPLDGRLYINQLSLKRCKQAEENVAFRLSLGWV
jgi:hypothetical protein